MMIGFFGGTFDPIHFGHLSLAMDILEMHHLDKIYFCLAKINPHKQDQPPISVLHRLKMLSLALEDFPDFVPLDIECQREGPSYTVDTLRDLIKQEPEKRFRLILGNDSISSFHKWKEPHEIIRLAPPLVGVRSTNQKIKTRDEQLDQAFQKGLTQTRLIQISGTEIRERLKEKLCCYHLIPKKVLDYIYTNRLYFKP